MKASETAEKRRIAINRIIDVVIEELEESNKGNLTSLYAIGVLEEAIAQIKKKALMQPCYLSKFES